MVIKVNDNGTLKSYQIPTGNPNWNSSQGEQGYIENRPFYSESSYVELINDTYSVSWTSQFTPTGWYATYINIPNFHIKEGLTYKIIINEVEYIAIAEYDEGAGGCLIGASTNELSTIGDYAELSYPFMISGFFINVITQDNTISELTINIYEYATTYHKIDSNFIDIDWNASVGNQGYIKNKPFYKEISSQTMIAEEQTVVLDEYGGAELTPVSGFEGLNDGEIITVTIDGNEYPLTVIKEDDDYQWANSDDDNSGIYYESGALYYWDDYSHNFTITISIAINTYTYHKLDSNYIDTENTIATQTYVDNAVSSAVGDIETLLASI